LRVCHFDLPNGRGGEHPKADLKSSNAILQADAYSGFNPLLNPDRKAGSVTRAQCRAHARRTFFEIADINIKRFDALFAIKPTEHSAPFQD
jgi:hypothetical protein